MIWLLDNGHGGLVNGRYPTPGKRSPKWPDGRQLFEGVFNRKVVHLTAKLLHANKIRYKLIVPEDKDISLGTRIMRVNDIYRNNKDAVLLSVHANAGGGTGWEIWTSVGQSKSDIYATVFWNTFKAQFPEFRFRADWRDKDPDKERNYAMVYKTHCPAILTENFFMDTLKPDCELIMSSKGVKRIAMANVQAILNIERSGRTISGTSPSKHS